MRRFAMAGLLIAGATAGFAKDTTFGQAPRTAPVIIAPPPAEVVAEAIKAEMNAYARRLDACTRLRQIAIETGNEALLSDTDEIEKQAAAIYQARVARLGVSTKEPPLAKIEARLGGTVDPLKVAAPAPLSGRASR